MAVLRLRQPLRRLAGDAAEHAVSAGCVVAALRELEATHPPLRGWILDELGEPRRHINVYVNGELAQADSPLGDDDRLDVLPAISGGR